MSQTSITCPVCNMTSYNEQDIAEGYCGKCANWTVMAHNFLAYALALPDPVSGHPPIGFSLPPDGRT